jgi:hypothetical protein
MCESHHGRVYSWLKSDWLGMDPVISIMRPTWMLEGRITQEQLSI